LPSRNLKLWHSRHHCGSTSGYVIFLESGSTANPIYAIEFRGVTFAGKLGRGYRNILLFGEAALFARRALGTSQKPRSPKRLGRIARSDFAAQCLRLRMAASLLTPS
jgi:hypothetical protein